jgi:hypothetical protein
MTVGNLMDKLTSMLNDGSIDESWNVEFLTYQIYSSAQYGNEVEEVEVNSRYHCVRLV